MGVTFYWAILLKRGKPGEGMSSSWFCSVAFPRPPAVLTLVSAPLTVALHVTPQRGRAWDAFSAVSCLWLSQLEWTDKVNQGRIWCYFSTVTETVNYISWVVWVYVEQAETSLLPAWGKTLITSVVDWTSTFSSPMVSSSGMAHACISMLRAE